MRVEEMKYLSSFAVKDCPNMFPGMDDCWHCNCKGRDCEFPEIKRGDKVIVETDNEDDIQRYCTSSLHANIIEISKEEIDFVSRQFPGMKEEITRVYKEVINER